MNTCTETSVTVNVAGLKAALPALSRIIRGRITLPVLGMVRVETCPAKQALSLTATDLNLSLRIEVPCLVEIEKRIAFLVGMEDLQRVVKTAAHPQQGIDLRSLRSDEDVADFPEDPHLKQVTTIQLDATVMENLFHAFTCVSEDQTRYVICGVYLDPADAGQFVGTDGRHLACFHAPGVTALKQPCILPDHRLWGWRGCRDSSGCILRLGTFARSGEDIAGFLMEAEGWTVTGKCIEGQYPNYRQVTPSASQFVTRVELGSEGTNALAEKLEQLARWKDTPAAVGLRIEKNELLLLHREKSEEAFAETRLSTARISGPEMTVMLNREYLMKAPRFGFSRMELIDAVSPVKFSGQGGFLIAMPMRCEGPINVGVAEQGDEETSPTPPAASPQPEEEQEPEVQQQIEQQHQPEHQPKTDMKPINGNQQTDTNGNGNGHRAPRPSLEDGEQASGSDPLDAAVQQLAQVRETLKGALTTLGELSGTLKAVRQQQRDTEREIRTVRSTIRSLKEIRL